MGVDTVTFIRRDIAGQDRYGNDVTVDIETVVGGCAMQPMWGQEMVTNLDQVIERYQLFLPALAVIDQGLDPEAVDAVRFGGLLYEINGKPQRWILDGNVDHIVIFCRRVEG
jgi:hypothetical protein